MVFTLILGFIGFFGSLLIPNLPITVTDFFSGFIAGALIDIYLLLNKRLK